MNAIDQVIVISETKSSALNLFNHPIDPLNGPVTVVKSWGVKDVHEIMSEGV